MIGCKIRTTHHINSCRGLISAASQVGPSEWPAFPLNQQSLSAQYYKDRRSSYQNRPSVDRYWRDIFVRLPHRHSENIQAKAHLAVVNDDVPFGSKIFLILGMNVLANLKGSAKDSNSKHLSTLTQTKIQISLPSDTIDLDANLVEQ